MTLSNDPSPLFECEDDVGGFFRSWTYKKQAQPLPHWRCPFSLTMAKAQSMELITPITMVYR